MGEKKKILFVYVAASLVLGGISVYQYYALMNSHDTHPSLAYNTTVLEEEMYFVDYVVKGVAGKKHDSSSREIDTGTAEMPDTPTHNVTPITFIVDNVIYGSIESDEITYLQHGTPENPTTQHLKEGEEYILFLSKTTDGEFWSYSFDSGIWHINNNKLVTDTHASAFNNNIRNLSPEEFIEKITVALENKKKPDIIK